MGRTVEIAKLPAASERSGELFLQLVFPLGWESP
jgi:hypothetical protein